jgi:parallel beta-helix repeat protein
METQRVALTCGQTVTASVTLSANLVNCPGNGLNVGANGITIDLGGHAIFGADGHIGEGIHVGAFNSVTITNGAIYGFFYGVHAVYPGRALRVQSMRVARALTTGIDTSAQASVITNNVVFDNDIGIYVRGASSQVTNNAVQGNGSAGIVTTAEPNMRVSDNRVLSNRTGISAYSIGATIRNNVANGNRDNGIQVSGSAAAPAKVSNNRAYFNTQLGIDADPSTSDLSGNKAAGNGDPHQCENVVCS